MIEGIHHKGLKLFWSNADASKLPPDQIRKIKFILEALNRAEKISDMNFPGLDLHPLKGNLREHWAVTVKNNWRITFYFKEGNARLIDYVDYH